MYSVPIFYEGMFLNDEVCQLGITSKSEVSELLRNTCVQLVFTCFEVKYAHVHNTQASVGINTHVYKNTEASVAINTHVYEYEVKIIQIYTHVQNRF